MRLTTYWHGLVCLTFVTATLLHEGAWAQSSQYKRKKVETKQEINQPAADGASVPATEAATGDKLDISDLEQKYWSSKDTDFSVVQNRTYAKEKRYALSLGTGPIINDAYSRGFGYSLLGNYYFSERSGVQVEYTTTNLANSTMVKSFASQFGGVVVNHNKVKTSFGAGYNFVPVYAKVSLLGKKILYFDMIITPGLAVVNYEQQLKTGNKNQNSVAFTLDVSQLFFLSTNFAVRADIKNRWYSHQVLDWGNGSQLKVETEQNFFLTFGGTYFFD